MTLKPDVMENRVLLVNFKALLMVKFVLIIISSTVTFTFTMLKLKDNKNRLSSIVFKIQVGRV